MVSINVSSMVYKSKERLEYIVRFPQTNPKTLEAILSNQKDTGISEGGAGVVIQAEPGYIGGALRRRIYPV